MQNDTPGAPFRPQGEWVYYAKFEGLRQQGEGVKSIILIILYSVASTVFAGCNHLTSPMTAEAIGARIKPVGAVDIDATGPQKAAVAEKVELAANAGEERYKSTCALCHATGVAGAPKFRDEADWKARMAVGMDEMLAIAIKGKGAMPPKGTCMDCSDQELRMTIEYMLPKK